MDEIQKLVFSIDFIIVNLHVDRTPYGAFALKY